jgi:O-antigen/teichoic acid export membrane protein
MSDASTGARTRAEGSLQSGSEGSLSGIAARGSLWMGVQAALNKLATAATMYVVALQLDQGEIGTGQFALSVAAVVAVFPPLVMCDVLVANQARMSACIGAGRRIARLIGIFTFLSILVMAALPPTAGTFPEFPASTLSLLLALLALRVLANADLAPSLALLRSSLRYRSIATIDGGVQLATNGVMLGVAFAGGGAAAIVLPHVFSSVARAALYRWILRRTPAGVIEATDCCADDRRRLFGQFRTASLAQYAHVAVGALPAFVLGIASNEVETGLYAFSYMLATQSTVIVAYQLGIVLQPIFGRLAEDPGRQSDAYRRVLRSIAAVAVPVSLLQCAFAGSLFSLLFSPKWDAALPTFRILSLLQAFHFGLAPTLSLLKSQARFGATLRWQAAHATLSACALFPAAHWLGAVGVAATDTVLWSLSLALGMTVAARQVRFGFVSALGISLRPWLIAAPVAFAASLGAEALGRHGIPGDAAALVLLAPLSLAVILALQIALDPGPLADLGSRVPLVHRLLHRFGRA